MSIAGYPTDPGDQGPHDGSHRPVPSEPPPDDWNAQFTAIVSGISGSMRWEATADDLDESAAQHGQQDRSAPHRFETAPGNIWAPPPPDTAEDRRLRRELRRQQRAAELAAHLEAEAAREAEMAADTEHFVPPDPPPLPRLKRRTVGALVLIAAGLLLLIWPEALPVSIELIFVLALLLILGGGAILVLGMRHHRHGDPREGWDDGAEV